jgi:hypothetical protein
MIVRVVVSEDGATRALPLADRSRDRNGHATLPVPSSGVIRDGNESVTERNTLLSPVLRRIRCDTVRAGHSTRSTFRQQSAIITERSVEHDRKSVTDVAPPFSGSPESVTVGCAPLPETEMAAHPRGFSDRSHTPDVRSLGRLCRT